MLKTLIAISETGSFAAAADEVCVSQAAVGQQMKRLEDRLQVTLFDRSQKTPRLNQLGKSLVPKAREIIHRYDTILDGLVDDGQLMGELTIGAIASLIRGLIPQSIKQLVTTYPKLHIRVVPGLSTDLMEQVERGALDAAVIAKQPLFNSSLQWEPFAEEEMVLLTGPDIEEDEPLRLLGKMPYIHLTRRASAASLADEWLTRNRVNVHASMEMESLDTLCSMVAHNLGVAIVPNLCVPDPVFAGLKKLPLGSKTSPRVVGLLTRHDCTKIRLVRGLFNELQRAVEDHRNLN